MPARKSAFPLVILISLITLTSLIILGIYFVRKYQSSEENLQGFFVCNKDQTICELSQHIHADISLQVCGKEISFPKEKGSVKDQHTHKEINKIHWESSTTVDPKTREPLDPDTFSVKNFLIQMEYTFPKTCPGNSSPQLTVTLNGTPRPEGLQTTWKDGDNLSVVYE